MAKQNFQIDLGTIYKNGVTCQNTTIVWEVPSCGAIYCEEEEGGLIKVQIPDGCTEKCFYGTVTCDDVDCTICDPINITVCPCELTSDCEACQTCSDNLCVSTCADGEFCDPVDEICVECDVDNPCPCNQVCVAGQCVCPPGSPFLDAFGCCSDCNTANPCDNCFYCTPNGCEPIVCPVGVCNPDTGECVDCNMTGDCAGPDECCVGNSCECCEGFVRDPGTGNCVVAPECTKDSDCIDCKVCDSGNCVDLVPPAGYVVGNPDDGCILKECDCDNPNCPYGSTCFPYDSEKCFCKPCSGHCTDDEPCPEGCVCDETAEECVPNSCFGPCDGNTPCPDGCGCQDGWCIPCYTLSCATSECSDVPGCACDGSACEGSGCQGPCDELSPCGEGCGCDQIEHQCVLCESKTCSESEDCPLGCYCNGAACVPNPCQYNTCESPNDCGEGCTCIEGLCIPCASFSCAECLNIPGCACTNTTCDDDNSNECNDELTLVANEDCTITAQLVTSDCCACPDIYLHLDSSYSEAGDTLDVDGFLRTGNLPGSPLLSSLNITNALPLQGAVTLTVKYKLVRVGIGSTAIMDGPSGVLDFTGTDSAVTVNFTTLYAVGDTVTYMGNQYEVRELCLEAVNQTIFEYENECRSDYGTKEIFCLDYLSDAVYTNDTSYLPKKLVRCKTPLFTLYRAAASNFAGATTIKTYAERVNSTTYRIVYESPDVVVCEYYKVTSDCGCDLTEIYECN